MGLKKWVEHRRDVKAQKQEDKHDELMAGVRGRNARTSMRQETQRTAYENGFDPHASMWQGISSLGQSASSAIGAGFLSKAAQKTGKSVRTNAGSTGGGNSPMIIIGLVLAVVMFWK